MSSSVDSYNDVLEVGREKMNEGDYLKLAKFLQTLHKERKIIREIQTRNVGSSISFETLKGKPFRISINTYKTITYEGQPQESYITGLWKDEPFEYLKDDFIKKFIRIVNIYGAKNIRQTIGDETEEYSKFASFKSFVRQLHENNSVYDDDEDDDLGIDEYYIVCCLFNIFYESY